MKKKILGIVITLIIIMGMMASQVNAATISASSAEINKGDYVTVTVSLDEATRAVDLTLNYDANSFEYVERSVNTGLGFKSENASIAGQVMVSSADSDVSTTSVTFRFMAKEAVEAATFTASGLETETGEQLTTSTVSVSVVEPVVEEPTDDPTQTPVDEPTQTPSGDVTNNEQSGSADNTDAPLVDENGNVITKLPQTGVNAYVVIGVLAVATIAVVLVAKKVRK